MYLLLWPLKDYKLQKEISKSASKGKGKFIIADKKIFFSFYKYVGVKVKLTFVSDFSPF